MTSLHARRNRIILVTLATVVVVGLLYVARGALFPFIIGWLLAYLLMPVVRKVESVMPTRSRWPGPTRVVAVLIIYVAALAILAAFLATVIPPVVRESREFLERVPELYSSARETVEGWNEEYTRRVPENVRTQLQGVFEEVGDVAIGAVRSVLMRTVSGVQHTISIVIGLAVVPMFLFYLLKDGEVLSARFYSMFHPSLRKYVRDIMEIADRTLGAYLRGQLLLGLIVGVMVFVGLLGLGIPFSVLLGIIAGVTELVPVIGPIIGAIPGLLVALATAPDKIAWVLLLYVAVQQIENTLLVPRIQGDAVNIHPAIILVILIVGSETAGIWGMVVSVPLAGVAKEVFAYLHREWSARTAPDAGLADAADPAASPG